MRMQIVFLIAGVLLAGSNVTAAGVNRLDEEFSVRQYEEFHHVLHPLQHEALPNRDFARIRSQSKEFVKRGDAIVKLGVPKGTPAGKTAEFKKELKNFSNSLIKFKRNAEKGTDAQLSDSFTAVHDSFEMLAGMLPRN